MLCEEKLVQLNERRLMTVNLTWSKPTVDTGKAC